jgi:hypothetical protein
VNNHPGLRETLALLDTLKEVVRDFTLREEKLNHDHRTQTMAAENAFVERNHVQEAAAHEHMVTAEAGLEAEKNRHQSRYEKRQAWIDEIHAGLKDRISSQINDQEKICNDQTQARLVEIEQQRKDELARAAATHEQFQQKLAEAETRQNELSTAARNAFRGYGRFRRWLTPGSAGADAAHSASHRALFDEAGQLQAKARDQLAQFKKFPFPQLFKFIPLWLIGLLLLAVAVADPVLAHFGRHDVSHTEAAAAVITLLVLAVIHWLGGRPAAPLAKAIAGELARAGQLLAAAREKSESYYQSEQTRIQAESEAGQTEARQSWRQALKDVSEQREIWLKTLSQKSVRLEGHFLRWHKSRLELVEQRQAESVARLKNEDWEQFQQAAATHKTGLEKMENEYQLRRQKLTAEWQAQIQPIYDRLSALHTTAEKSFPAWTPAAWENWTPPAGFGSSIKFAQLEVNLPQFTEIMPRDSHLAWPGPTTFNVPLFLTSPQEGSILFEGGKTGGQAGGESALPVINNIIFRLLSVLPPGKVSFTIFDPVGLGQNFATLMHLADYEETSINSRIWTQTAQLEEKLAELNEHMEKVIQMYLRNEYATIAEYNAEAGSVAEKYHFLVIASFPVNFSDVALRRLRNIAASGARCGVYTLIHWDQRNALPPDFVPDELRRNSLDFVQRERDFEPAGWRAPGVRLLFDPPPPPEFATQFLHRIGEAGKNSSRVEVPFSQIAPPDSELWQEDTTEALRVPIGRSGATKLQYLEIGRGTRQHALIAGKTGSGKSTLFHVMITNLALRCSPEQVEFYLVDFKKGVEFKCYAGRHLPHARVVAIESDREFGLSVLHRVDAELRRRGDLFRKLGAQDLAGYKRAGGTEPMPRTLLMIDEFQEFFTEEDHISQGASVLLDRIVRQGRAFGIHVLLGSQTLGGAYTLARATMGQMVIRIALQCNEADALLIMEQDNPAPRLLSRPGEGIYNDDAGSIEGNSPFQAVWLSDQVRDAYLAKIRTHADQTSRSYPGPIVFEGNAPADVRENYVLHDALRASVSQAPIQASVWLGAPNSIKGPTEAIFRRQSGSNLLVVAQSEERTLTLLSVALISLAAQYPKTGARFVMIDSSPVGSPQHDFLQRTIRVVPHEVVLTGNANLAEVTANLAAELKQRAEDERSGPEIFVLIHSLQNFKKLRQEDEFSFSTTSDAASPAAILLNLITEGPSRGIHVIVTCDTYNNVNRFLGRKTLTEFEMRVVFQMSATDSASLIDAPNAANLGLHRALYYNDREGQLETFRPYSQPGGEWLEESAGALAKRP